MSLHHPQVHDPGIQHEPLDNAGEGGTSQEAPIFIDTGGSPGHIHEVMKYGIHCLLKPISHVFKNS